MNWRSAWLVLYAAAIVLFPPLTFHGKNFFAAEILLLPLVIALAARLGTGRAAPPPKRLWFVFAALLIALAAGYFRGEILRRLTIYVMPGSDRFGLYHDVVPFIRWALIFATPWIVAENYKGSRNATEIFLTTFKFAVLISAGLALAEHRGWFDPVRWNYHAPDVMGTWPGRSYGTFASPLEASLVYGVTVVYLLTNLANKQGSALAADLIIAFASFGALLATHGGTGVGAMVLALLISGLLFKPGLSRSMKIYFFVGSLAVVIAAVAGFVPRPILMLKWDDFTIRFGTWFKWLSILPQKPWILFVGIGFSGLIVDNSIVLLLIKGGLFLLITVGAWFQKLYRHVPKKLIPVFLFWGLSWLTLDSWGFWGIGRLCWLLLGLSYSNFLTESAE